MERHFPIKPVNQQEWLLPFFYLFLSQIHDEVKSSEERKDNYPVCHNGTAIFALTSPTDRPNWTTSRGGPEHSIWLPTEISRRSFLAKRKARMVSWFRQSYQTHYGASVNTVLYRFSVIQHIVQPCTAKCFPHWENFNQGILQAHRYIMMVNEVLPKLVFYQTTEDYRHVRTKEKF